MLTGFDLDGDGLEFIILEPPAHGTLTGTAPNLRYAPHADFHGTDSFTFISHDGVLDSQPATVTISVIPVPDVVGRYVFYNDSAWDGNDAAANPADDLAIAVDKRALLPGQQAEFVHYTSYDKGLNGLMIDLDDLAAGTVLTAAGLSVPCGQQRRSRRLAGRAAADFGHAAAGCRCRRFDASHADLGRSRRRFGISGFKSPSRRRRTRIFPSEDVFYFGNAIGESGLGNGDGSLPPKPLAYFPVNVTDEIGARNHPHTVLDPAGAGRRLRLQPRPACRHDGRDHRPDSWDVLSDRAAAHHTVGGQPRRGVGRRRRNRTGCESWWALTCWNRTRRDRRSRSTSPADGPCRD